MKASLVRLAKLSLALFIFDRIAVIGWELAAEGLALRGSGMERYVQGWAGAAMTVAGCWMLYSFRDRLESLLQGAVAGRTISLRPERLHPLEGAAGRRLGFSLALSFSFAVLAAGVVWLDQALTLPDSGWVLMGGFAALCGLFWWSYSTAEHRFYVRRSGEAGEAEALILFLSENKNLRRPEGHPLAAVTRTEWPDDGQLKREFNALNGDNCLMPMLSIWHQLRRAGGLRFVLVIPSKETYPLMEAFRALVDATFPGHGLKIVEVGDEGVDYLDPTAIWGMLHEAHKRAYRMGARSAMLDLTAGKAQCSAAAAVASLTPGRVFKYVDTNSYRQWAFEIAHEAEAEVPGQ